jgi:hypothetical protein
MLVVIALVIAFVGTYFADRGHRWAKIMLAPMTNLAPLGGPGSSTYEDFQAERRHQELLVAQGPRSYTGQPMSDWEREKIDRVRLHELRSPFPGSSTGRRRVDPDAPTEEI